MDRISKYINSFFKNVVSEKNNNKKSTIKIDKYGASVSPKYKSKNLYRNDLETGFQDTYFVKVRKVK